MIKYVFWDFNGTILDDLGLCVDLLNEILKRQDKKPLSETEYLEVFGFPLKDYYEKAGITYEKESFMEIANFFIVNYQPASLNLKLHEGVKETLEYFQNKNIKNICLSASQKTNLLEQLKHYGILKYFDEVIGTDNIIALGKDELGFSYILKNNIKSEEVIYIGDTTYDFEVSQKMKVKSILFTKGHHSISRLKQTGTTLINKISDIIKIVEGD